MYQEELEKEEDEFHIPPHPELEFKLDRNIKFNTKGLVIAFYGPASLFCRSLVAETEPSARINFKKAKQKAQADIYSSATDGITYLIFNQELQDMKEIHLARFINNTFKFEECIVLVSKTKKQLHKQQSPSLRFLATSKWSQRCVGIRFDETLQGSTADLLAWGQFNGWSLVCYIGIFGEYQMNRNLIEESFGPIRGKYGLERDLDITSNIKAYNMSKYSNKMYL